MAPQREHCVANVVATQVLASDGSILVEPGNFTPMKYFLDRSAKPDDEQSDNEPPTKKRKTGSFETRSLRTDTLDESTHIPISKVTVDLAFVDTLNTPPPHDASIARDVVFDDEEEAIHVIPSVIDHFDDGHRLKLVHARNKGATLMVDVVDLSETVVDALRTIADSGHGQTKNTSKEHDHPATLCRCTLTRSSGSRSVVRLEATLFWRSGWSAFPAGSPTGRARIYPDYDILVKNFPDRAREEVDHSNPFTPRDFYESVHTPPKDIDTKNDFNGVLGDTELYPFQKRALHWMLQREGVKYSEGKLTPFNAQDGDKFFERVLDLSGRECFVSHLLGIIKRFRNEGNDSGGILAEEMGLGKTIETMALIALHKPPLSPPRIVHDAKSGAGVIPSKATLIITPSSILKQWCSELSRYGSLRFLIYDGVASKKAREEDQMLADLTSNYDVVLSTYQVLTREIHFAEDPPDRNMRKARKFERKRSPLVKIKWWRVCLDEAQMVESGVSAAARVASRIERIHSWAISGTPLKKNVEDLRGLLIFLRNEPFASSARLWAHAITNHRHILHRLFSEIALRNTKSQVRDELILPEQKRVVLRVPFSAIEQEHYNTAFASMCTAVGVDVDGSPRSGDWDPTDQTTIASMRDSLKRLRELCLHPGGTGHRKALGRGRPLRTVAEVLEVMIEEKETSIVTRTRSQIASKLLQGHILANNAGDGRSIEQALKLYLSALEACHDLVNESKHRLAAAEVAHGGKVGKDVDTEDEASSSESTPLLGSLRNGWRTSLQLNHACMFFAATAYFQIKSNIDLTEPDTDRFKELEEKETSLYESAKATRKILLKQSSSKAELLMGKIRRLVQEDQASKLPRIKDLVSTGGIESRRIVEKSDELFDIIREQGQIIEGWRAKMAEYLRKPLVDDQDDGVETSGDEYENSTKEQEQLYAYLDAFKAMHADITFFVTGQDSPLIDFESKGLVRAAKIMLNPAIAEEVKTHVHAPELVLDLFAIRDKFAAQKKREGFSIRGLIQETRAIEGSLHGHESGARAAERALLRGHLSQFQSIFSSYSKALESLEEEISLFRMTQNSRLDYYRQLQELSDDVRPYREEPDETLDTKALENAEQQEQEHANALAQQRTQHRYLVSLRENEAGAPAGKICAICQEDVFENGVGVLTVCGHQFCKICIQHWWSEKKSCPTCKRKLNTNVDFHIITYKPQELRAQEEVQSASSSPSEPTSSSSSRASIYSDVDSELMKEIKSIDLPASYSTKIDLLCKHLLWIRGHDPDDPGAKSIVFSQFRGFLDVLATALSHFKIGFARLGRSGAVEKFKQDPSVECLLLDAKTDSSGLTLVNATHVFICEPLTQNAIEAQAVARVHRIGQTRTTTIWMYVVNDTVEENIHEISVARRLAHVHQSRQSSKIQKSRSVTPSAPLPENAIDAADSEELKSAPISKLLVAGKSGGELVGNDDLWQCLFGNKQSKVSAEKTSEEAEMVVGRYRRAEAAEERRREALDTNGGAEV